MKLIKVFSYITLMAVTIGFTNNFSLAVMKEDEHVATIRSVEDEIETLSSTDPYVRVQTTRALGAIGEDAKAAIPALIKLLNDDSDITLQNGSGFRTSPAYAAADALAAIGKPAVDMLIDALKDEDAMVRKGAISALGRILDSGSTVPLIAALTDEDKLVRWSAVTALKRINDVSAVKPLIALLDDEAPWVRKSAAKALSHLKWEPGNVQEKILYSLAIKDWEEAIKLGEDSIEPLKGLLKDKDSYVRKSAAKALADLHWKPENKNEEIIYLIATGVYWRKLDTIGDIPIELLIGLLNDGDADIRVWVHKSIVKSGKNDSKTVSLLINSLKEEKSLGIEDSSYTYILLAKIGIPAVDELLPLLNDTDWRLRNKVVMVLGEIRDPRVIEPLTTALNDIYPDVRVSALEVLGRKIGSGIVDFLVKAKKDESPKVRMKANEMLLKIGGQYLYETSIKMLKDADPDIREEAIVSLWRRGVDDIEFWHITKEDALEPLIDSLGDEKAAVREAAVVALGFIGGDKALEQVLIATNDKEESVRNTAKWAAGRIKGTVDLSISLSALNSRYREVRYNAAGELGKIKASDAVRRLIEILAEDESYKVRGVSAWALGEIKDEHAVEPLVKALYDNEGSASDKVSDIARIALIKIKEPAVTPLLNIIKKHQENKESKDVLKLVIKALGSIRDKRAVEPLISLLKDKDYTIRLQAAHNLGYFNDPQAIKPLIDTLQDNELAVKKSAIYSLSNIDDKNTVPPLLTIFKDRLSHRDMAKSAFEALKKKMKYLTLDMFTGMLFNQPSGPVVELVEMINDPRAVEYVIRTLRTSYPKMQITVLKALTTFNDKRAVEPIVKVVSVYKDRQARIAAINALKSLDYPRAIETIIEMLKHPEEEKRKAAIDLLIMTKEKEAVSQILPLLDYEDASVRAASASTLGNIGDKRTVEPLVALLEDESFNVQENAVRALGNISDTRAVEPLIALLNGEYVYLMDSILDTLSKMKVEGALEHIIDMLDNEYEVVRIASVEILGNTGDARAVEPLIALLEDNAKEVRLTSIRALGVLGDKRAIEPLIMRMKDENDIDTNNMVRSSLIALTGKSFGMEHEEWFNWWKENKLD